MGAMTCRFCESPELETFVDLGMSPLANSYVSPERLNCAEPFFPLHAYVCQRCFLVQLEQFETPAGIFSDYAYFSSFSDSWLEHCRQYVDQITDWAKLGKQSQVVELASNDGYLLQYFQTKGIPVLGIEPAANVAKVASEKGIPTTVEFFGRETATELAADGHLADLIVANNVLAHVPDLNDFVAGIQILLKPTGVITVEVPHLLKLIENNQFDTIYHEHFSYFSLLSARAVFAQHGLTVCHVERLPTHGGSLRIYARHADNEALPVSDSVEQILSIEKAAGLESLDTYQSYGDSVAATKRRILQFLIQARSEGKTIVGYGAPAKGNTLLNYCGVRRDFINFTVDRSPFKQGRFLPGTRIPIEPVERIREVKPDYLFILPWNLRDEISKQMNYIRDWGGQFVVPIPEVEVF